MILENIVVSAIELNTAVDVVKDVTAVSIAKNDAEALLKTYRPVEIRFSNASGVAVDVDVFTADEYTAYLVTPTLSDKTTIAIGGTLTFDKVAIVTTGTFTYVPVSGRVTTLVISSGAFAGTFDVEIWKE